MKKILFMLLFPVMAFAEGSVVVSQGGTGAVVVTHAAEQSATSGGNLYISTNSRNLVDYQITSTDTVVFASGTITSTATYQLPYSTNGVLNDSMQTLQITKVDATTGPIKIIASGTDMILGSTTTVWLYAMGQTASLISDGKGGWWPYGIGIQTTPPYEGIPIEGRDSQAMAVSSDVVICPFTVEVPIAVTGFKHFAVSGAGDVGYQIYDQMGNLVVSTGPVAATTFGVNTVKLASIVNLYPGQYFYGIQISNTVHTIGTVSPAGGNGSMLCSRSTDSDMEPPNPFVFGTSTLRVPGIYILVNGGRQTI